MSNFERLIREAYVGISHESTSRSFHKLNERCSAATASSIRCCETRTEASVCSASTDVGTTSSASVTNFSQRCSASVSILRRGVSVLPFAPRGGVVGTIDRSCRSLPLRTKHYTTSHPGLFRQCYRHLPPHPGSVSTVAAPPPRAYTTASYPRPHVPTALAIGTSLAHYSRLGGLARRPSRR